MKVEQDKSSIRLHLANYIQDTLLQYKAAIKKFESKASAHATWDFS
jgi:hypothetical protein